MSSNQGAASDEDINELERNAQDQLDIEGYRILPLIQRVREAEAEALRWQDKWRGVSQKADTEIDRLNARIAQLERVREAATELVQFRKGYEADPVAVAALSAALAAVDDDR